MRCAEFRSLAPLRVHHSSQNTQFWVPISLNPQVPDTTRASTAPVPVVPRPSASSTWPWDLQEPHEPIGHHPMWSRKVAGNTSLIPSLTGQALRLRLAVGNARVEVDPAKALQVHRMVKAPIMRKGLKAGLKKTVASKSGLTDHLSGDPRSSTRTGPCRPDGARSGGCHNLHGCFEGFLFFLLVSGQEPTVFTHGGVPDQDHVVIGRHDRV